MIDIDKLLSISDGITFSEMRKLINSTKTNKKTNKNKKTKKRKKHKKRIGGGVRKTVRKVARKTVRRGRSVPPSGVVILKKGKLYRSNGKKMVLLNH
tara:strand:- start:1199 stop:1489 length:291 start_codon:yes stop_codon:yes gene_type:complete